MNCHADTGRVRGPPAVHRKTGRARHDSRGLTLRTPSLFPQQTADHVSSIPPLAKLLFAGVVAHALAAHRSGGSVGGRRLHALVAVSTNRSDRAAENAM